MMVSIMGRFEIWLSCWTIDDFEHDSSYCSCKSQPGSATPETRSHYLILHCLECSESNGFEFPSRYFVVLKLGKDERIHRGNQPKLYTRQKRTGRHFSTSYSHLLMARYYCDYCKSYIKNDSVHLSSACLFPRAGVEKSTFVEVNIEMLLLNTIQKYAIHT